MEIEIKKTQNAQGDDFDDENIKFDPVQELELIYEDIKVNAKIKQ